FRSSGRDGFHVACDQSSRQFRREAGPGDLRLSAPQFHVAAPGYGPASPSQKQIRPSFSCNRVGVPQHVCKATSGTRYQKDGAKQKPVELSLFASHTSSMVRTGAGRQSTKVCKVKYSGHAHITSWLFSFWLVWQASPEIRGSPCRTETHLESQEDSYLRLHLAVVARVSRRS